MENVDNLIRHDNGNTMRTIINRLELVLNYKVIGVTYDEHGQPVYDGRDFVRNSKYFGVPQNRPRTYIMAFDRLHYGDNLTGEFPNLLPDHNDLHIYEDLNDLLEFGAEPRHYMASGYLETLEKHKERQKANGNGFGYIVVNRPGVEHPIANTILATGGSGKERNLVYDPQDGVAGMAIPTKTTPLNSKGIRVMTPREWGKLQGFIGYAFLDNGVDIFEFPEGISECQKFKQFGNSVTIPVLETLAEFMCDCFTILGEPADNE